MAIPGLRWPVQGLRNSETMMRFGDGEVEGREWDDCCQFLYSFVLSLLLYFKTAFALGHNGLYSLLYFIYSVMILLLLLLQMFKNNNNYRYFFIFTSLKNTCSYKTKYLSNQFAKI